MSGPMTIFYEPFTLNLVSGNAYLNGAKLPLTQKEFSLLLGFIKSPGEIISAENILSLFWEVPVNGDFTVLKAQVSNLRKKLHESNSGYTIKAIRHRGYCFQLVESQFE
jgi:DNA-binding response OmpR family regulator